jgi:hypothetical protein
MRSNHSPLMLLSPARGRGWVKGLRTSIAGDDWED